VHGAHRVTIMGGVHGNEQVGIEVVKRLVNDLRTGKYIVRKENCVLNLVFGNLEAIKIAKRGSAAGADLNRAFTLDCMKPVPKHVLAAKMELVGTYEAQRARELAPLLSESSVLVDLHATNKPSEPFIRIAGCCTAEHLDLASWYAKIKGCESETGKIKLLLDPNFVLANKICTTDEFVGAFGNTGICVETGLHNDTTVMDEVYERTVRLLEREIGLSKPRSPITEPFDNFCMEPNPVTPYGFSTIKFTTVVNNGDAQTTEEGLIELPPKYTELFHPFELISSHPLTDHGFTWTPGLGTSNWQFVERGTVIGNLEREHVDYITPFENSKQAAKAMFDLSEEKPVANAATSSDGVAQTKPLEKPSADSESSGDDQEDLPERKAGAAEMQKMIEDFGSKTLFPELNVAMCDSYIIFPKTPELQTIYKPLYWLAKEVELSYHSTSKSFNLTWNEREKCYPMRRIHYYRENVLKRNRELFLSYIQKDGPAVTRGKKKDSQEIVVADKSFFLDNAPGVVKNLQIKILNNLNRGRHNPVGFNVIQALRAIKSCQAKALPGESVTYDRWSKQVLHMDPGDVRPVYVYPTSYRVGEEYFNRGYKPYFSPRLSLPCKIRRIEKDGELFLGIQPPDELLPELREEIVEFDEIRAGKFKFLEHDGALFIDCPLVRSAYLIVERAPTDPPVDAIAVVGNTKLDVGRSYHRLSRVIEILAHLSKSQGDLVEFHPAFSDRGEVHAVFGVRQAFSTMPYTKLAN